MLEIAKISVSVPSIPEACPCICIHVDRLFVIEISGVSPSMTKSDASIKEVQFLKLCNDNLNQSNNKLCIAINEVEKL